MIFQKLDFAYIRNFPCHSLREEERECGASGGMYPRDKKSGPQCAFITQ